MSDTTAPPLTIVEFLTARLDEAERDARLCAEVFPGIWVGAFKQVTCESPESVEVVASTEHSVASHHIERHEPAAVLADIAAKRAILERYERAYENSRAHPDDFASKGALLALHGVVHLLASVHSDHPDYRQDSL